MLKPTPYHYITIGACHTKIIWKQKNYPIFHTPNFPPVSRSFLQNSCKRSSTRSVQQHHLVVIWYANCADDCIRADSNEDTLIKTRHNSTSYESSDVYNYVSSIFLLLLLSSLYFPSFLFVFSVLPVFVCTLCLSCFLLSLCPSHFCLSSLSLLFLFIICVLPIFVCPLCASCFCLSFVSFQFLFVLYPSHFCLSSVYFQFLSVLSILPVFVCPLPGSSLSLLFLVIICVLPVFACPLSFQFLCIICVLPVFVCPLCLSCFCLSFVPFLFLFVISVLPVFDLRSLFLFVISVLPAFVYHFCPSLFWICHFSPSCFCLWIHVILLLSFQSSLFQFVLSALPCFCLSFQSSLLVGHFSSSCFCLFFSVLRCFSFSLLSFLFFLIFSVLAAFVCPFSPPFPLFFLSTLAVFIISTSEVEGSSSTFSPVCLLVS